MLDTFPCLNLSRHFSKSARISFCQIWHLEVSDSNLESDEELFEDDPIDYIRLDLEGSDTDTRRRAAGDLVRGLLEHFAKNVTDILSSYISLYLKVHLANPEL